MPGVRYGPDISDDAAYFVDKVKEIQAKIRAGGKPNATERTTLANAASLAKNVFGVSEKDFNKGKLGDMADMARYGGSKPLSRRAKDSRTGTQMTKSVAEELLDRSTGKNSRGSRTKPAEGTYYEGRTRSKRFRELEARATKRLNRNGLDVGKRSVKRGGTNPKNFKDRVDGFQFAKTRGNSSDIMNRVRGGDGPSRIQLGKPRKDGTRSAAGFGIRPPLAKSQQQKTRRAKAATTPKAPKSASSVRAAGKNTKRKAAVKKGGKTGKKK
jgi:hypothetical protein